MAETSSAKEHEGLSQAEIDELVAQADTGGRNAGPFIGRLIAGIALVWSLFQLWFASPLPFALGFGVFNDTEARSIHLAFAIVLAFLAFPPARSTVQTALGVGVPLVLGGLLALSAGDIFPAWVVLLITVVVAGACALPTSGNRVAIQEWAMAIVGGFCAAYIFLFYRDLADRVGQPIFIDYVVSIAGLLLLLEAYQKSSSHADILAVARVLQIQAGLRDDVAEAAMAVDQRAELLVVVVHHVRGAVLEQERHVDLTALHGVL